MGDDSSHRAIARTWARRAAAGVPPEQAIHNFEEAFSAVWRRANRTLSDVTLMAILDRVLYEAVERFPMLAPLSVEPKGLGCEALLREAPDFEGSRLVPALEFVLAEFMTVLGKLVAEILSPGLHAEVDRIMLQQASKIRLKSGSVEDREES